jgi:hypothetical protein
MRTKAISRFYKFGLWCILVLMLSILGCVTQKQNAETSHLVAPGHIEYVPLTEPKAWEKIIQAADEYKMYAPIPRVGFSDITSPASVTEYQELDGYGLLVVTVLSQKEKEVPVKRTYFRDATQIIELEKLYQQISLVPDEYSDVIKVFGKYRADTLYIFPLYCRVLKGELVIDFMENREGFVVTKFPMEKDDMPVTPPSSKTLPMTAINKLIKREVPLFAHFIP